MEGFWLCMGALVVLAAGVVLLIARRLSGHTFACRHCGRTFSPDWKQMIFEIHALDAYKIRCPHCRVKDFCTDRGRIPKI